MLKSNNATTLKEYFSNCVEIMEVAKLQEDEVVIESVIDNIPDANTKAILKLQKAKFNEIKDYKNELQAETKIQTTRLQQNFKQQQNKPTTKQNPRSYSNKKTCIFFQRGYCRNGSSCKFKHLPNLSSINQTDNRIRGTCKINGTQINFLIDTGATRSTISLKEANRLNLNVDRQHLPIILHDGSQQIAIGTTDVNIDFMKGEKECKCNLLVLQNGEQSMAIGMDYLKQSGYSISETNKPSNHMHVSNLLSHPKIQNAIQQNKQLTLQQPSKIKEFQIKIKPNVKPVKFKQKTFGQKLNKVMTEKIKKMEELNIIRKSKKPGDWNWSIIPANPTKDQNGNYDFRPVLNGSEMKEFIEMPKENIPKPRDIMDKLHGFKLANTFDLVKSFWQVPVTPETSDFLSFTWEGINYNTNRALFGSPVISGHLQQELCEIIKNHNVLNYIDDIIQPIFNTNEYVEIHHN